MTAEMKEPMFTNVALVPALPSCQPRPSVWLGSARAMIGLMTLVVKALTRVLNASATIRPTATTMTSPLSRKFLKPRMLSPVVIPASAAYCITSVTQDAIRSAYGMIRAGADGGEVRHGRTRGAVHDQGNAPGPAGSHSRGGAGPHSGCRHPRAERRQLAELAVPADR